MKKIIYTLLLLAFAMSSCNDFLDLPKEHVPNTGDYFKSVEEFRKLVNGAYSPLRAVYDRNHFVCGEMRSDNSHYEYYPKMGGAEHGDREAICNFLDGTENWYSNGLFNNSYKGIARTNTIISRMHNGIPEADRKEILGEAHFLRGLYYYNLVRFFGAIPKHIKEVTSREDAYKPLSPAFEIFALVESDLQIAINGLQTVKGFPQSGRATKGAAQALLASVYLYQKKYDAALLLLSEVEKQGYDLLLEYSDAFSTANKNGKESIFEVQFGEGNEGLNSIYLYNFLPKALENSKIIGLTGSNTLVSGGCNVPTDDIMRAYETGDKRFNASVAVVEGHNEGDNFISDRMLTPVGYQPADGILYRYMVKKYMNPHKTVKQTSDNWPVIRYADVLLMKAECLNETGKTDSALIYINKIRPRAGLDDLTETDQAKLRAKILHERRIELAFENHRWHDLVRTGNAITVMNAHGVEMKAKYGYLGSNSYNVTQDKLIFPIPDMETIWNPEI